MKKDTDLQEESQTKKKKNYTKYSLAFRMQVVQEVMLGQFTVYSAAKKYRIKSMHLIQYWIKKYGARISEWEVKGEEMKVPKRKKKGHPKKHRKHNPETIKKALKEIDLGIINVLGAANRYGICHSLLVYYRKKFEKEAMMNQSETLEDQSLTKEQRLEKKIKELESKLEYKDLKLEALEELVNVAENQLNIEIRKKPGARQLK
ncbi:MAG: hypothetical protein K2X86_08180 [Cytophagaceae bacterium]|nr:hypothetical protein [Cytophagaceae bacterium]